MLDRLSCECRHVSASRRRGSRLTAFGLALNLINIDERDHGFLNTLLHSVYAITVSLRREMRTLD